MIRKMILLVLCSSILISTVPCADAQYAPQQREGELITEEPVQGETLLDDLVESLFQPERASIPSFYADPGSDYLHGPVLAFYESAREQLKKTALEGGSSVVELDFTHPYSKYLFSQSGNTLDILREDAKQIFEYLRVSYPEYLYWSNYRYSFGWNSRNVYVKFYVDQSYAPGQQKDGTEVDGTKIGVARRAQGFAQSLARTILDTPELDTTEKKLFAIAESICSMTTYDHNAADHGNKENNNPWQIVYVFDQDPSTNVVCEGYAKAFRYLCELVFDDDQAKAYCVTGQTSGNHMWNVVSIGGVSYLTDLTAMDAADENGMFLDFFLASPAKMPKMWQVGIRGSSYQTIKKSYNTPSPGGELTSIAPIMYIYDEETCTNYPQDLLTLGEVYAPGCTVETDGETDSFPQEGMMVTVTAPETDSRGNPFTLWRNEYGTVTDLTDHPELSVLRFPMPGHSVTLIPDYVNLWTSEASDGYAGGTGTAEDPFQIAAAEQLAYLAKEVNAGNDYAGKVFCLTEPIDLSGKNWMPVGTEETPFRGVLQGSALCPITGLTISSSALENVQYLGLIGYGAPSSALKGICLKDSRLLIQDSVESAGILAGTIGDLQEIQGEYLTVSQTGGKTQTLGGLAGSVFGNAAFCGIHHGTFSESDTVTAGGLIGAAAPEAFIESCYYHGTISYVSPECYGVAPSGINCICWTDEQAPAEAVPETFALPLNDFSDLSQIHQLNGMFPRPGPYWSQNSRNEPVLAYGTHTPSPSVPRKLTASPGTFLHQVKLPKGWVWDSPDEDLGNMRPEPAVFQAVYYPEDYENDCPVFGEIPVYVVGTEIRKAVFSGLDAPVKFQELDQDVQCENSDFEWRAEWFTEGRPVSGMARPGRIYTLKLVLTPKENCYFSKETELLLNGEKQTVIYQPDGSIFLTKNFPRTADQDWSDITGEVISGPEELRLSKKGDTEACYTCTARDGYGNMISVLLRPTEQLPRGVRYNQKTGILTVACFAEAESVTLRGQLGDRQIEKCIRLIPYRGENIPVFQDVPQDSYCRDAVYWAAGREITTGTSYGVFSPETGCTRAQAVTFLWRAFGCPSPGNRTMVFKDVPVDSYYRDAVLWAVEQGITTGISETEFSPDRRCTRSQIVTFLWRAEGMPEVQEHSSFTDVNGDDYFCQAVSWAGQMQITHGTSDTSFSPEQSCTRGQIVTFLYRCFHL